MPLRIAWGLRTSFLIGIAMPLCGQNAMAQIWSAPAPLNDYAYDASGNDDSVQLTTDGAGNYVAVWSSRDSLSATVGTDRDIHVARSTDGGVTWTDPVALNSDAATDAGDDWYPQIVTDGAGKWVAVWSTWNDASGNQGPDSDVRVSESTDNGATWSTAVALNSNAATDSGDDFQPQVIVDPAGTGLWIAVWYSNDDLSGTIGTDYDILLTFSLDGAFPWGSVAPQPLNTNAGMDSGDDLTPQIAVNGSDDWVAVWRSDDDLGGTVGTDEDIFVARSLFGSPLSWESPRALNANASTDAGDDFVPQVTVDSAGNWVAAWYSYDDLDGTIGTDLDILTARSTDAGATWTTPVALNTIAATDSGDDFHPQITTDDAGLWLAIWYTRDDLGGTIGDDRDIVLARSTDGGMNWTAPAAVNDFAGTDSSGAHDYRPQVTTDAAGNWIAVWHSNYSQGTLSGLGPDDDILVARSANGGVSWSNAEALNNNAGDNSGSDGYQQVVSDGAGNWIAVWHSWDDLGGTVGADGDIVVSASNDDGLTWTSAQPLNTNAPGDTGLDWLPTVATDRAGRWVALWSSDDDLGGTLGTDPDILVATSLDNGGTWTAPSALNSNAVSDSGVDTFPGLATDGAGNWIAVWWSSDDLGGTIGTDGDVLISVSDDNASTWSGPGPLNNNAVGDIGWDNLPQVATDAAGHWVVVWYSNNDLGGMIGSDSDVLVATSTNNGLSWTDPQPLNGNAGTDAGDDLNPQLATDGNGTWIAAWYSDDDLGGTIGADTDILYAVSQDDGETWTAPQPMNGADSDTGGDWEPKVSTDGNGNWMIAWASAEDFTGTIGTDRDIVAAISNDNGMTWTDPQPLNANADSDSGSDSNPQIVAGGFGTWIAVWDSYDSLGGLIGAGDTDLLFARTVYPPGDIIIDLNMTGATDVVQDPAGAAILLANPLTSPLDLRPDDLAIGNTAVGEISIGNGGQLYNAAAHVGYQVGATGIVVVSGMGSWWTCTERLYVGNNGTGDLLVQDGGIVSSSWGYVATEQTGGTSGTVTIDGAGSEWSTDAQLFIGYRGVGELNVQNGGTVSTGGSSAIGDQDTAVGSVLVDGVGSAWNTVFYLDVGDDAVGSMTIQNGGSVSNNHARVGHWSNGDGAVVVDGAGSTWATGGNIWMGDSGGSIGSIIVQNNAAATIAGGFDVGIVGNGSLTVQSGGSLSSGSAKIGKILGGTGVATVSGTGSAWNNGGDLRIGDEGDGQLTLHDGGVVTVGANAFVDDGTSGHGTLALEIGTNGPGLLDVTGSLTIGESSTLQVTLASGIVPILGQQYTVVTADGGVSGAFAAEDLQAVSGATTITWAVHHNPTDITLEVVDTGVYGDCDDDGDVDLADFACFQNCFTGTGGGPPDSGCNFYDADSDGDIDSADFEAFVGALTGPGE